MIIITSQSWTNLTKITIYYQPTIFQMQIFSTEMHHCLKYNFKTAACYWIFKRRFWNLSLWITIVSRNDNWCWWDVGNVVMLMAWSLLKLSKVCQGTRICLVTYKLLLMLCVAKCDMRHFQICHFLTLTEANNSTLTRIQVLLRMCQTPVNENKNHWPIFLSFSRTIPLQFLPMCLNN